MYRVDVASKTLIPLKATGFAELSLRERFDIQEWVEKTPNILGEDLLVVAKELTLPSGKRLDLLCLDRSGNLVVVELKRDDSGNAVEWQAIKYASYCARLLSQEVIEAYARHHGQSTEQASRDIGEFIDGELSEVNARQRIILVSREFNSEVISAVLWLRDFDVDIQCTRLAPFLDTDGQLFIKPEIMVPLPEAKDYIERKEIKQRAVAQAHDVWSGYWFVNVGEGEHRTWEDNQRFGFLGAGQGQKYSSALRRLSVGDLVFADMKGMGYVGYGEVESPAMMIRDFVPKGLEQPLLKAGLRAPNAGANQDDAAMSEWVVGIRWIKTFTKAQAKTFTGVFANQNVVCKLRHAPTVSFLEHEFGLQKPAG